MMRVALPLLLSMLALGGCRDWDTFSSEYDAGGGSAVGGGSATGGGTATGGGGGSSATGGGTATGGGAATGGGSATGGGGSDSCTSHGTSSCPAGVLFCDGFNEATLRPAWVEEQTEGTIGVGTECIYLGDRALHAHLNSVAANVVTHALIIEADSGTPLPGTQFIRVMIRVKSPVPDPQVALITVRQNATNFVQLQYGAAGLTLTAMGGAVPSTSVAFPLDTWTCVEWQLEEGSPGVTKLWLDGSSTASIEGAMGVSALKTVTVGAQMGDHSSPVATTDVYFDELVVSTTRVGCP